MSELTLQPITAETSATSFPSQSAMERSVEVVHLPNADVVINNDREVSVDGYALGNYLQNGIPGDWQLKSSDTRNPTYVGEFEGRSFLAKPKALTQTNGEAIESIKAERDNMPFPGTYAAEEFAAASVLSEISLAPDVKRIVSSEDARNIVSKYGYKSITYVEPILGITRKSDGQKTLVYEYLDNVKTLREFYEDHLLDEEQRTQSDIDFQMGKEIQGLLRQLGIKPVDFSTEQILIDKDGNLFLIDAEKYIRMQPETGTLQSSPAAEITQAESAVKPVLPSVANAAREILANEVDPSHEW